MLHLQLHALLVYLIVLPVVMETLVLYALHHILSITRIHAQHAFRVIIMQAVSATLAV
jgi:hypothetical protein